uniref:Uncharacterized protein n=1 Tax=Rhizophora mucronata TaxID=61149 RepID=A0A2P2IQG7_RHIMU
METHQASPFLVLNWCHQAQKTASQISLHAQPSPLTPHQGPDMTQWRSL